MNVRVANSGKGIARKVRFEFLDRQERQVTADVEPIVKVFHKLAMFRLGVQSLGINQELTSFLFSFHSGHRCRYIHPIYEYPNHV